VAGAGFLALAAVPVLALNSLARAEPGAPSASEATPAGHPAGHPARPALTDAQRECLAAHGVTLPTPPAPGTKPTPPAPVSPDARRAAAAARGLPVGPQGPGGPGGRGRPGPGLI
jgi:hypothetical protein